MRTPNARRRATWMDGCRGRGDGVGAVELDGGSAVLAAPAGPHGERRGVSVKDHPGGVMAYTCVGARGTGGEGHEDAASVWGRI